MHQLDQRVDPEVTSGLITKDPAKFLRDNSIDDPHPLVPESVLSADDGKMPTRIGRQVAAHFDRFVAVASTRATA
jgi:hypothetical protein